MSNYKSFDRHEVFEMSDTSFILDMIGKVDKYDYKDGGAEVSNMLFGLFDGYWYSDLYRMLDNNLKVSTYDVAIMDEILSKIAKAINMDQSEEKIYFN